MDTFRKIVRINISHKGRTITFIHGIGDGILKAAIRKELDEVLALRCSYCVGDPASFSFFICFSTPLSVTPTSTDSSKVVIVKIY